jgi:IS5 family transposase
MRQNCKNQLPLSPIWPDHQLGEELREISKILDQNPEISDLFLQDLCDKVSSQRGAPGMSPEQVFRCAILKQVRQFSYQQLAFHLADSFSAKVFCRFPLGYTPGHSVLQENISRIQASTWEQVNRILVGWAAENQLEKGRKIRIDATTVETEIHHPTDSELLSDGIEVITRLLIACEPVTGRIFTDHRRRAKKRRLAILNHRGKKRKEAYRDLLKVARKTESYGRAVLKNETLLNDPVYQDLVDKLQHYLELHGKVIGQTQRRVFQGESVPAPEKVVSLFEEHTDIIQKGGRETVFGHKIYLTCGKSSLMLDCVVERGNPADSTWTQPLLERQRQLYGRVPRQASLDGCFASKDNLKWAKKQGVRDVAFAKKAGLKIEQMAHSSWIYQQLRRFRAGIEGCISTLKRAFGLRRCNWKGWDHFQQYVQLSVVSFNLVVLARLLLR